MDSGFAADAAIRNDGEEGGYRSRPARLFKTNARSRPPFPAGSALNLEMFRRGLALVWDFFVLNDLALVQRAQTGLLDRRDMDKDIFAAALRLNKPIALLGIEPLHRAARHSSSPLLVFHDTLAGLR
jgi:hypothetical protein